MFRLPVENPPGAGGGSPGGTVTNIEDEGVPLAGGPFDTINFTGPGVTATNTAPGEATVNVPVDPADIADLDTRVTAAEADIVDLDTRVEAIEDMIDIQATSVYYENFILNAANAAPSGWTVTTSGAGVTAAAVGIAGHLGVVQFSTGSTSTGRVHYSSNITSLILGGGVYTFQTLIQVVDLSTVAEEFILRCPTGDIISGSDHTDGVYFVYDRLTFGNVWVAATSSGGSRTFLALDGTGGTVNSPVQAATWVRLEIVVAADLSSVQYRINNTLRGTIATNIPASAFGFNYTLVKSAGGTARLVYLDDIQAVLEKSTPQ